MGTQRFGPTIVETAASCPDELSFLAAILRDQLDDSPKLAYATWLEARDDPRAAFVREFVARARDPRDPLPLGDEFPLPWRQAVGLWHRRAIRVLVADGRLTGPHAAPAEAELLRRARPTIHLLPVPAADTDLPPGATKFGGRPDLAGGTDWPVDHGSPAPMTLVFCAQLRLSDLQGTLVSRELPTNGLLSFFHLPDGSGRVLVHPEAGPFRRPDPPHDPNWDDPGGWWFDRSFYPLPLCALRLIEGLDLPLSAASSRLPEVFFEENAAVLDDLRGLPPGVDHWHVPHLQLLGYGREANAHPSPDRRPGVRRLATFGLPDDRGPSWPPSAQPFWYIAEADLAAGRFDLAGCFVG